MVHTPETAPHMSGEVPALPMRTGQFWIPGEISQTPGGTVQAGPMYVQWFAPAEPAHPYPLVFVHGGGSQGTDWISTVDGRPGWALRAVEAGYAVYVVDRVGYGRSPFHPDITGELGAVPGYEMAQGLFFAEPEEAPHSAWPWGTGPGDPEADQLVASFGALHADLAVSQELDSDRLARVLDRIGPAILVTHSAGGPVGWLTAQARPDAVRSIVAVEPMGPMFAEFPGLGSLEWGLTAAPITYEPPCSSPQQVRELGAEGLTLPGLAGTPVLLVTGEASPFAGFRAQLHEALTQLGVPAEALHLPERGLQGNGHAMMLETNSDQVLSLILDWTGTSGTADPAPAAPTPEEQ